MEQAPGCCGRLPGVRGVLVLSVQFGFGQKASQMEREAQTSAWRQETEHVCLGNSDYHFGSRTPRPNSDIVSLLLG